MKKIILISIFFIGCDNVAEPEDCAGEPGGIAVEDCNGICGGTATEDCYGVCEGTSIIDCNGVCGGYAIEDCNGVCGGYAIEDCNGVCGGSAVLDCAGICDGDTDCLLGNWLFSKRVEMQYMCYEPETSNEMDYSTFDYTQYKVFMEGSTTCTINSTDCECTESDYTLVETTVVDAHLSDVAFKIGQIDYPYTIVTENDVIKLTYFGDTGTNCYKYILIKSDSISECP
tara:strand:+ start:1899 stop:2582 length:684 start_codon:yes stop_codon:yes gene_type:complete